MIEKTNEQFKKIKQEHLKAINDIIKMLNEQNYKKIYRNSNRNNIILGVSEIGIKEEELNHSWTHIIGIYDIFLQLIINKKCDVKIFILLLLLISLVNF